MGGGYATVGSEGDDIYITVFLIIPHSDSDPMLHIRQLADVSRSDTEDDWRSPPPIGQNGAKRHFGQRFSICDVLRSETEQNMGERSALMRTS